MKSFKKGDRVYIKENSEYYLNSKHNPKDICGTVIIDDRETLTNYYYRVKWDNGGENSYRDIDLRSDKKLELNYEVF